MIAFIYFTCAEADANWQNEETIALYDLLERHAGDLTREQSVAIAQEAYVRYLELAGRDARLRVIDDEAPKALGHLSQHDREQLLDEIAGLFRVDGRVTRGEESVRARIRQALRGAPQRPPPADRGAQIRVLAFIYFTFASADDKWQNEETVALYDFLEQQAGSTRDHGVALAQEAYETFQTTPASERLAWLAARIPGAFHAHDVVRRKEILHNLVILARADGKFSPEEGHLLEEIRKLLAVQA